MTENKTVKFFSFIGFFLFAILIFIAVFAPLLSPYDPYEYSVPYLPPGKEHILGTNDLGYDILSELIYGSRVSLSIGMGSALLITVLGCTAGFLAGYYGGKTDVVISAIINIITCIPSVPFTVILVAVLGRGLVSLIIAISVTSWTATARLIRTKTMELKEMPFVQIEKNLNVPDPVIIFRHLLPNMLELIIMRLSLSVGSAILSETGLSFLGVGLLTQKSWGNIIHYAFFRNGVINGYWWWIIPPILMTSLTVMSFVFMGHYGVAELLGKRKERKVEIMVNAEN